MVGLLESFEVLLHALIGGDNLPNLYPCARHPGSSATGPFGEYDAGTPPYPDGLDQEIFSNGGEVPPRFFDRLLNFFQGFCRETDTFLKTSHGKPLS